ncbi:Non-specific serine/threonine protein kinase [Purpureocillium takamizusanense]|uniref:Non-specific serine/threonine protein kinase n=1 Tax=Purpureocillium takamizusanense TaxID=2060973 RepID=A0A9Q8QI57_9HYPO|nr:Non-specific serine/threonine protein kinase [Purpureocillium takamizusanense]UNI21384.1 Non-specific serine/threonine protein kinase [Purpureocillium takamizusanense]
MASLQPGQQHLCAAEHEDMPDKCLLMKNSQVPDEEVQELIPLRDGEILMIGRDPGSDWCVKDDLDFLVSRKHCEFYVVKYDQSSSLVYVRDRNSRNGTYVNRIQIGKTTGPSPGYLLKHGDVINILPYWSFTFCDKQPQKCHALTEIQQAECKLFDDKYVISQRCLGQGADGVVYLATESETKKQVVCKVVSLKPARNNKNQADLRRKLQEADVLRQLQHPNIVPFVDAIVSPHSLYTFTELATGGDLWSFIYRHGKEKPLGEYETRVITRQVVRGLQYLHRKGVVHRDLKPENILLAYSPRINCHRVMLSDFGACAVPNRSRMVTRAGTPNYQAPEIRAGAQSQTAAVDIWSLGIIVHMMLSHNPDCCEASEVDEPDQENCDELQVGEALGKGKFSRNCEHFVWRCLQVLPSDRMTAREAKCHDWLCKPERLCERFRELDRRTMADWKPPTQLRPMPMELPNVLTAVGAYYENNRSTGASDCLHPSDDSEVVEEPSQYFQPKVWSPTKGQAEPDRDVETIDFPAESRMNSLLTETTPIDMINGSPEGFPDDAVSPFAQAAVKSTAMRVAARKVRIQDASRLPVPSWKRRLLAGDTTSAKRHQKEQVPEMVECGEAKSSSFGVATTNVATLAVNDATRGPAHDELASSTSVNTPALVSH